jgi:hypothetical protein
MEQTTEVARRKAKSTLSRLTKRELSTGTPSRSVLGLPIRRSIPQDVHSVMDYGNGAVGLLSAFVANTARARIANTALSAAATGVSALTDYKLSVAKVIPIEVHEAIDYVWGISNVLAPFALGYRRKDKLVSFVQIAFGLGTIAASMITDYRAFSGVRWIGRARSEKKRAKG